MIKSIQFVIITIIICIIACKSQKDSEKKDDRLIEQTKGSAVDEKPKAKEVMTEVSKEKKEKLSKIALEFIGNSKLTIVNPEITQVMQDKNNYYVAWPNKNHDMKPSAPGGDVFQLKVIIDKKTNELVMIKLPN